MTETHIEELLLHLKEILALEAKAKELYDNYLQQIRDKSIVDRISRIRDDEVEHIEIASQLTPLIKYKEYSIIREGLETFSEGSIILVHCGLDKYVRTGFSVLKYLVDERGLDCVYVAVNKPSSFIIEALAREDINVEKVSFIDCSPVDLGDKRGMVVSPENPTDLSMAIETAIASPEGKFVYFDSISTYFLFHESNIVERFVLFLAQKLRAKKVGLVLLVVKEEIEERSLARLTVISDKRINVP